MYQGSVGAVQVREFMGAVTKERASKGYLVTTGSFSAQAKQWVQGLPLELVDKAGIDQWQRQYHLGPYQKKHE
jgi:restriction endonuclease Mrr